MQGVFKAIYSIQKLVNFKATISVSCSFGNQYRCLDIKTLLNFSLLHTIRTTSKADVEYRTGTNITILLLIFFSKAQVLPKPLIYSYFYIISFYILFISQKQVLFKK